jgi:hypothetical protein
MATEITERKVDPRWLATNGSVRFSEPDPTPDVINWDLRPTGEVGNSDGAEGREIARLKHLLEVGAVTLESVTGKFTRTIHDPVRKTTATETVVACIPIPISEMIPHGDKKSQGYITPLWPEGKSLWLLDLANLPTEK